MFDGDMLENENAHGARSAMTRARPGERFPSVPISDRRSGSAPGGLRIVQHRRRQREAIAAGLPERPAGIAGLARGQSDDHRAIGSHVLVLAQRRRSGGRRARPAATASGICPGVRGLAPSGDNPPKTMPQPGRRPATSPSGRSDQPGAQSSAESCCGGAPAAILRHLVQGQRILLRARRQSRHRADRSSGDSAGRW